MLLKKSAQYLLMLVMGLGVAGMAQATLMWDFRDGSIPSGNVGIEETFTATDGTSLLSATGWTTLGLGGATAADVYVSRAGVPLNWGLGVKSGTDGPHVNQLDAIDLIEFLSFQALGAYSIKSIEVVSGLGDRISIFGSNSADASGAYLLLSSMGTSAPQTFSFDASGYNFVHIQPGGGDAFRVATLYAEATVPEPTTLTLIGIGLAGIGFVRRKKI